MLDKYFNYKKHKTDFKTEVIAGTTTFLTMAYIMFLNPFILSGEFAGTEKGFFDFGAAFSIFKPNLLNIISVRLSDNKIVLGPFSTTKPSLIF